MKKVILVKLGGSLITDKTKPFTTRPEVITRIAHEVALGLKTNKFHLVIGNGGGSFPHTLASQYETIKGFGPIADSAAKLNRIIVQALINEGINASSINPSSTIIARGGQIKEFYLKSLLGLLKIGITPVVYGDIVLDEENNFSIISTEKLLSYIALELKKLKYNIQSVIYCTQTDGVLDKNQQTIRSITPKNYPELSGFFYNIKGFDVTGGMDHKIKESLSLAQKGVPSVIINGLKKDNLKKALLGEKVEGTIIHE